VVVASIDTYLKYSEAVGAAAAASRPALETSRPYDELAAENASLRAQIAESAASSTRVATPRAAAARTAAAARRRVRG
jgi:hypothetical protein